MKRPKTKTILICVGLFFFFLLIRFPISSLKNYMISSFNTALAPAGITVYNAESVFLTFLGWPGIGFKNIDLSLPDPFTGGEKDVSAKKLTARVGIGSLFPPSLSFSVAIDELKGGGNLYVKIKKLKPSMQNVQRGYAYAELRDVNVSQFVTDSGMKGVISGELDLDFDLMDAKKNTGSLWLKIKNLQTPPGNAQGFPIPGIKLGDVDVKTAMRNSKAEINAFKFGGGAADLTGDFTGEVEMATPLSNSSLNLNIKIDVADAFAKSSDGVTLVTILDNFDKRQPGKSYRLRWNKSFQQIAYNFLDNGPVPAN